MKNRSFGDVLISKLVCNANRDLVDGRLPEPVATRRTWSAANLTTWQLGRGKMPKPRNRASRQDCLRIVNAAQVGPYRIEVRHPQADMQLIMESSYLFGGHKSYS